MRCNRVVNPILPGHRADPEIRRFGDRYFIYPTFSAPYEEQTFFEAFSSPDLVTWTNEGRILDFADVPWSTHRAAWAPSCLGHAGRYFLYFSAGDGAGIGVAVADRPEGPFRDPIGRPLVPDFHHGAQPIDAFAFEDDDGRAYLYWGGWRHLVVAELGPDRVSLITEPVEITPPPNAGGEGYVEGPAVERIGERYLLMWSEGGWGDASYRACWGWGESPYGPFSRGGTLLESDPEVATGAGHHSILRVPGTGRWLVCYHRRPLGETNRHARVTCLDEIVFDESGDPLPVRLTHEGFQN